MSTPAGLLALALLLAGPALPAAAEPFSLVLDPAGTRIAFEVEATLHTVRGTFALEEGSVRFDPEAGTASGEVRVDARSGETGIARRDRNMHRDVLASEQYPSMVLRLQDLEVSERGADRLAGVARGTLELRGERHPIAVRFEGARDGARATISAGFRVPYVEWGVPDPSTFILWVGKTIDVEVTAEGTLGQTP